MVRVKIWRRTEKVKGTFGFNLATNLAFTGVWLSGASSESIHSLIWNEKGKRRRGVGRRERLILGLVVVSGRR